MSILTILIITLFQQMAWAQPKCASSGIPEHLPSLIQQHILLDMNRYFDGPNLTLTLSTASPSVHLRDKYSLRQQVHNLGEIISIATAGNIISMLGRTSVEQYYIYFSNSSHPHQLQAQQLPGNLTECTKHAQSPSGYSVAITCEYSSQGKLVLVYGTLGSTLAVATSTKYGIANNKQVWYMTDNICVVVVSNPFNSYIQLWDMRYVRLMGIYDRTFLNLQIFNIMDVQISHGVLYVLDYETGVYKFQLKGNKLELMSVMAFSFYSKMAVNIDSFVISKKGSITQYNSRNTFKYESVGNQAIKELIISQQYIVVYTKQLSIVYLRGLHTPYFTYASSNHQLCGVFISPTEVVQAISAQNITQVLIQQIQLTHPYLKILSTTPNNTFIQILAVSKLYQLQQHCKLSFTLIRTHQQQMQIFENVYSKNVTQHIYMNRPGRAQIDLSPYGMGPDLQYTIHTFSQTVNLTADIRKIRKVQATLIQGLDKFAAKGTYFSQSCGLYRPQCPMVIDGLSQSMLKFYSCRIQMDFYGQAHKINCTQKYRQFKFSEYSHYTLAQLITQYTYFYQISVYESALDQIRIRKFSAEQEYFKPILQYKYKIPGSNLYKQNNITKLQLDQSNRLLYVLLKHRKQLQIYHIQQPQSTIRLIPYTNINSQMMGSKYWTPRSFEIDSDDMVWVKCFDQIYVIDVRQANVTGHVQILSIITIDNQYVKTYDYDFQVIQQYTHTSVFTPAQQSNQFQGRQQQEIQQINGQQDIVRYLYTQVQQNTRRNKKYLVIYDVNDTLLMCTVSDLYQVDLKQLQNLPRYGYHVPKDKKHRYIQSLGNSQVFVILEDVFNNIKVNAIYNLNSLSLVQVYYGQIQTKNISIPAYFHLSSTNPIIVFIQPNINMNYSQCISYQISKIPKMVLTVSDMAGQSRSQLMVIQVYNKKDLTKYSVVLGISNSPQNLTKGDKYPYPNVKKSALDKYIQIDTVGWIQGNVLKISYACQDCKQPHNDSQQAYIDIKGKLWWKQNIQIIGAHQMRVIQTQDKTPLIGLVRNNVIYVINTDNHNIVGLFTITQAATDSIIFYKYNSRHKQLVSVVRAQNNQISVCTFSLANDKGFPLSRIALPGSVQYVINMDYAENVCVVLDMFNIYILSIDAYGSAYVVDYINQIEAGGIVCWVQLLTDQTNHPTNVEYKMIITLCEGGITYILFTLEDNLSILKIKNKQNLDLKASLNQQNIRMPTDASFRRTKTIMSPDGNTLSLFMVVSNFNSIQWTLFLKNKVVINQIKLQKIIHRYGDISAMQHIDIDKQHRFVILTYYGYYQSQYQYVHAIYDLYDTFKANDESYTNCYIMQAIPAQTNKLPQFTYGHNLIVLSNDGYHVNKIDTDNKFRAVIHNEEQLYSQSIFMIPYTPVSSISIQIVIRGIDIVYWEVWQIMLIALFIIIIVSLSIFIFKVCFVKYQENKKLVPLLVDYAEYEEDLAQEIQQRRKSRERGSLLTQTPTNRASLQ